MNHRCANTDVTTAPGKPAGVLARTLDFHDQTLPVILSIQSGLGSKAMIRSGSRALSYADAPATAARYACALAKAGIEAGDRVAILMSNRIEQIELWLGITWLGAIMVPINIALRGDQLRHAVSTAEPVLVITESDLLDLLANIGDVFNQTQMVFTIDQELAREHQSIGGTTVRRFETGTEELAPYPVKPGDTAAILYTSGTTGASKGVLCPHGQFYWWGVLTGEALQLDQDDVLFTVLPFFHTNALNTFWQALLFGATYSFAPYFSAREFWQQARQHNASVTYLLGSMAQILLKQTSQVQDRQHGLRIALCPATPLEMVQDFEKRFGIRLIEGYGSTETNLVFSNMIGEHVPASMGRVVEGFEVRLVDENDCDVAEGEPGELIVRNREPFSMSTGYFSNPYATVKAWRNLWFHTGDRVYRGSGGAYYFLDRLVDAVRRRGENISSWEVENALMSHPDIEIAAVVGVPSDLGSEQEVMAFVVARPGQEADPVKIIRFLESRLAYFAIPRFWEFVPSLPITENGKVKKHVLRAQGVTAASWDREREGVVLNRGPRGKQPT